MTGLAFRPAETVDRPRILEIAAQVWEGDDYIPDVIDAWLAPGTAQLVVALLDERVVALARYDRTFPGYAWFEGLRTDPAYQQRGLAKALTAHLIEQMHAAGVERIGLSTYLDNDASQRISAGFGFDRVATFVYATTDGADAVSPDPPPPGAAARGVERVPVAEAAAFIATSAALRLGQGFLPHSWRFYPFARGPQLALGAMQHVLGIRAGGALVALLCIGDHTPHGPGVFSIDFLDGERDAVESLAHHALYLARGATYVEAMLPWAAAETPPAFPALRAAGLKLWNDGQGDVFVYERGLP